VSEILIEFAVSNDAVRCDEDRLREIVSGVLQSEGVRSAEVSIAIVGHADMREMNRRYLDHDYDTDVLSFRLDDGESPDEPLEGQLVVDAETALKSAAEFDWSAEEELILYLVHGSLHLVGYDDHSDEDRAEMRKQERVLLSRFGIETRGESETVAARSQSGSNGGGAS